MAKQPNDVVFIEFTDPERCSSVNPFERSNFKDSFYFFNLKTSEGFVWDEMRNVMARSDEMCK